ncbi:MAG: hypothetical protein ACOC1K_02060 [Nanoarchaeota archaeon]
MNKQVFESLNQYNDYKFFTSLLEEKEEKDGKKKKMSKEDKNIDPEEKKELEERKRIAESIVKKAKENLKKFKSAAGNNIKAYAKFWKDIQAKSESIKQQLPTTNLVYPLWDSDFVVVLFKSGDDASDTLGVFKQNLEEDEKNPYLTVKNPEASKEFSLFFKELKSEFNKVKADYKKNVVSKQKEKEREEKRNKLQKFLGESRKSKRRFIREMDYRDERGHVPGEQDTGPHEYTEDINSENDFRKYAYELFDKAHGDNYSKERASSFIENIIDDVNRGDISSWGEAVGITQHSLGD